MRWFRSSSRVRDGFGLASSAGFTGLVFGVAPICALLWAVGISGSPDELLVQRAIPDHAVTMAWGSLTDIPQDGEREGDGATEDAPPKQGRHMGDPSNGDGSSSERILDAAGDDGADDITAPTIDGVQGDTPTVADRSRQARGARRAGSDGSQVLGRDELYRALGKQRRGRKRRACKESHPDVAVNGEDHWTVNRNLVEYYTSSFKRFNSLGWSGPYNNEVIKGWKIGGFGCNSPLHFAGLRRGDIVLTVNSKKTRTWMQVFGAYTRLKRHDEFEVVVIRRGKRKTLHYTLVEGGPPSTG